MINITHLNEVHYKYRLWDFPYYRMFGVCKPCKFFNCPFYNIRNIEQCVSSFIGHLLTRLVLWFFGTRWKTTYSSSVSGNRFWGLRPSKGILSNCKMQEKTYTTMNPFRRAIYQCITINTPSGQNRQIMHGCWYWHSIHLYPASIISCIVYYASSNSWTVIALLVLHVDTQMQQNAEVQKCAITRYQNSDKFCFTSSRFSLST
jgi:hypothetical protein